MPERLTDEQLEDILLWTQVPSSQGPIHAIAALVAEVRAYRNPPASATEAAREWIKCEVPVDFGEITLDLLTESLAAAMHTHAQQWAKDLRELAEKWRAEADQWDSPFSGIVETVLKDCANELETALNNKEGSNERP